MSAVATLLRAGARDLLRNRWIVGYAAVCFVITDALFWFGGTGPQVVLSLLNLVLLLVPFVALVFGVIHSFASRDFVTLLLAQPLSRRSLFWGLYLGMVLPIALAAVIGIGIPFALVAAFREAWAPLLALLVAVVALSTCGGAIALWISLGTEDRVRGVGTALLIGLAGTILFDGVVLAIAVAFGDYPIERPLLFLQLANPVDIARVLVLSQLDVAALMGYTGALFERTFGTALGALIAVCSLALWSGATTWMAARRFRTHDF